MPTVVITGGAGGLGLAAAKILGQSHRVVIADVNKDRIDSALTELANLKIKADGLVCDITNKKSVAELFSFANKKSDLRAVVHAAGVSPLMGEPEFIIKINALGTINIVEAALKLAKPGFAVVNVASIAGHTAPGFLVSKKRNSLALTNPQVLLKKMTAASKLMPKSQRSGIAYSLSKQFVICYSAEMAARFGKKGARILSISPGSFDTEMGRLEKKSGSERLLIAAALKRFGTPTEMGELLAFCASEKAGYLTGVDILNDGGTKAGLNFKTMLALAKG